MTFSDYNAHTNPLFISLGIVKFNDLIFYHNALFMFDYHTGSLPDTFQKIFLPISQKHSYNTRLASRSSYSLPKIRTTANLILDLRAQRRGMILMKILKVLESLNLNKN